MEARLKADWLRRRTETRLRGMDDATLRERLQLFLDTLEYQANEKLTCLAWQIFLVCVERFGNVQITGDMEEYGREPGDIVSVGILGMPGVTGIFPEAMAKAALAALENQT